jgi:hypothetical protein
MKKITLVLGILVMAIGIASAQELKPLRVNLTTVGMSYAGSGLDIEYVAPVGDISLGAGIDLLYYSEVNPWTFGGKLRLYPLSPLGDKLFGSIIVAYHTAGRMEAFMSVGSVLGWRWILFNFVNLSIGAGVDYNFASFSSDRQNLIPRLDLALGIAF